jgi:hypothetical protein
MTVAHGERAYLKWRQMKIATKPFHPVRRGDRAIHVHPFVCPLAHADFDGDLVAIFLPVTSEAQHEAGQRLSIAAHVQRDPSLIQSLVPTHDAMWGLAHLSLTPAGRQEIADIVGTDVTLPDGLLSRVTLGKIVRVILDQQGIERTLTILEQLMRRGFAVARASGASICAFIGASLDPSHPPQQDDRSAWEAYREALIEQITSRTDYDDNDLGVQLLAIKSGARGSIRHIPLWFGGREAATDVQGHRVALTHGVANGLTTQEVYAGIFQAHEGLGRTLDEWQQLEYDIRAAHATQSFNVLARAMRSQHPGVVFAHAAAIGEIDPLVDIDSRLFVGLPSHGPTGENMR